MRLKRLRIDGEVLVEVKGKFGLGAFVADEQLHAVAGGENKSLADTRMRQQRARFVGQLFRSNGETLTQFHGCGLVVEACEEDLHEALNLWTELKRLAAQTQSMTRKTPEDR